MTHPSQCKFPHHTIYPWVELRLEQSAPITGGWWAYHTTPGAGIPVTRTIASSQKGRQIPDYNYGYYGHPPQP